MVGFYLLSSVIEVFRLAAFEDLDTEPRSHGESRSKTKKIKGWNYAKTLKIPRRPVVQTL